MSYLRSLLSVACLVSAANAPLTAQNPCQGTTGLPPGYINGGPGGHELCVAGNSTVWHPFDLSYPATGVNPFNQSGLFLVTGTVSMQRRATSGTYEVDGVLFSVDGVPVINEDPPPVEHNPPGGWYEPSGPQPFTRTILKDFALWIDLTPNQVFPLLLNARGRIRHSAYLPPDCIQFSVASLEIAYCGPAIGNAYCSATTNSSGLAASISAFGSSVAGNNAVILRASDLPPDQVGIFLTSKTQGFSSPSSSQGNLCLDDQIGRYTPSLGYPILGSGSTGSFDLLIDLTNTPQPTGPTAILMGETWNFQAWFRDRNPGQTSNFTNGASVTFL